MNSLRAGHLVLVLLATRDVVQADHEHLPAMEIGHAAGDERPELRAGRPAQAVLVRARGAGPGDLVDEDGADFCGEQDIRWLARYVFRCRCEQLGSLAVDEQDRVIIQRDQYDWNGNNVDGWAEVRVTGTSRHFRWKLYGIVHALPSLRHDEQASRV